MNPAFGIPAGARQYLGYKDEPLLLPPVSMPKPEVIVESRESLLGDRKDTFRRWGGRLQTIPEIVLGEVSYIKRLLSDRLWLTDPDIFTKQGCEALGEELALWMSKIINDLPTAQAHLEEIRHMRIEENGNEPERTVTVD